ncbi:MAG TPA: entericidin A [Verrucomicrobiales bacterium]|nr:entericidin A [Verrucomicrobiales bacterium]
MRAALILLASALASSSLSSCNTARGIGTDVRSAGRGIERAADRAH